MKASDGQKKEDSKSLSESLEQDVINYLVGMPFEAFIAAEFDPSDIDPSLFAGSVIRRGKESVSIHRLIIESYLSICESDTIPTANEIALGCGAYAELAFFVLERMGGKPKPSSDQVRTRLERLRHEKSFGMIKNTLADSEKENLPFHQTADLLRNVIDKAQSQAAIVQNQAVYFTNIVEGIRDPKKAIPTGIKYLDRLLGGGLYKETLLSLSGGAGAGKSAFALQISDALASRNVPVIYISMEVSRFKLTERSLKRFAYLAKKEKKDITKGQAFEIATEEYKKIMQNLFIVEGYQGMLLSEVRGMVLRVMNDIGWDVVLFIDPFQRLGTGNEKIDLTNETLKVNNLCSGLKRLANDLKIPIIVISDTTKEHESNLSGEGSARGSYMVDHTVDVNIKIRSSRDPYKAIYGITPAKDKKDNKDDLFLEDPFKEKVSNKLEDQTYKNKIKLESDWDKYAALVTSKQRDGGKFSPLFRYSPGSHYFEEIPVWETILPKED